MTQKLGVMTFSKKVKQNPEALQLMNGDLKKTYKRNVSVPTYPQKFDRIRLIFDEGKKA